jgi:putative Mg2+ transporter-C (MgtC) family protein
MAKELTLSLKAIYSATAQAEGKTEIRAEVMTREEYRKLLDLIMGNMGGIKLSRPSAVTQYEQGTGLAPG